MGFNRNILINNFFQNSPMSVFIFILLLFYIIFLFISLLFSGGFLSFSRQKNVVLLYLTMSLFGICLNSIGCKTPEIQNPCYFVVFLLFFSLLFLKKETGERLPYLPCLKWQNSSAKGKWLVVSKIHWKYHPNKFLKFHRNTSRNLKYIQCHGFRNIVCR